MTLQRCLMDKAKLIDLAFEQWAVQFKNRSTSDKKTTGARSNFETLFQTIKDLGADFNDAEPYRAKAIKVHQPLPSKARDVYKRLKSKIDKTEKEFIEEWNDSIESVGTEVFFEFFPPLPIDHDPEPKV